MGTRSVVWRVMAWGVCILEINPTTQETGFYFVLSSTPLFNFTRAKGVLMP